MVVGGGPAGLAAAAMLAREGIDPLILERSSVGSSWRKHYDRLRLHTVRWLSALPGLPIDRSEGPWVARDGVVRYLEDYVRHHRLHVRTGVEVEGLVREGGGWLLRTNHGAIRGRRVVIATGFNREPFLPEWPGAETFTGELVHSGEYRKPRGVQQGMRRYLVVANETLRGSAPGP